MKIAVVGSGISGVAAAWLLDRLERIRHGRLEVRLPDGSRRAFGGGDGGRSAEMSVHRWRFFGRLLRGGDVGAGESYMDGDWNSPDPVAVARLFLANETELAPPSWLGAVGRLRDRLLHLARRNTRSQARRNIGVHYATTLNRWRARFWSRVDDVKGLGFGDRFIRMWDFYLATCEAAFAHRKIGDLQIVLARPGATTTATESGT